MTIEEFKDEVEQAVRLYLSDYFREEYSIEWDLGDQEYPRAEIKITSYGQTFIIPIGLGEDGEAAIEAYEDHYLSLDGEGIYTVLFFESLNRLRDAAKA